MARRLARISPEAGRWIKNEIAYFAARSPQAAAKFAANLRAARERLMHFPHTAQRGVIPDTRRVFVKPGYISTVRVREGVVEVAAIRNARQGDAYAPSDLLDENEEPAPGEGSR